MRLTWDIAKLRLAITAVLAWSPRLSARLRRSIRAALLGALVLLALPTAGPAAAVPEAVPPFRGPANGPKVAAVGDSLLGQLQSEGPTHPSSTEAFTRSLIDEGWRASVKHRNAWRTARVRLLAGDAVERGAQVVIVSGGSGDVRWVRESGDPVAARRAVRRAVRNLIADLDDQCVVWPTLHPSGGAGERLTAAVLNDELDAADAAAIDVRSPDWADLASDHPGWFIGDSVHFSPAGEAAFQRTLLAAARRCVAGLPT